MLNRALKRFALLGCGVAAILFSGCSRTEPEVRSTKLSVDRVAFRPELQCAAQAIRRSPTGFVIIGTRGAMCALGVDEHGGHLWSFQEPFESPNRGGEPFIELDGVVTLLNGSTVVCGKMTHASSFDSFFRIIDSQGQVVTKVPPTNDPGVRAFLARMAKFQCIPWDDGALVVAFDSLGMVWNSRVAIIALDGNGSQVWSKIIENFPGGWKLRQVGSAIVMNFGSRLVAANLDGKVLAERVIDRDDDVALRQMGGGSSAPLLILGHGKEGLKLYDVDENLRDLRQPVQIDRSAYDVFRRPGYLMNDGSLTLLGPTNVQERMPVLGGQKVIEVSFPESAVLHFKSNGSLDSLVALPDFLEARGTLEAQGDSSPYTDIVQIGDRQFVVVGFHDSSATARRGIVIKWVSVQ